ncbi:anti-sigma factor antagonist [Pseudonocardiaceae bacterium YIM PH 21723]|nr:anti-sigma factor antagonist [Pseudonocardiaceae bacterium YIM PH 21723]
MWHARMPGRRTRAPAPVIVAREKSSMESPLITQATAGEHVVLNVHGELDLATANQFREQLTAATGSLVAPTRLVVDLTDVQFMSSSGMAELIVAHERCKNAGTPLIVVANHSRVLRPLQVAGLDALLTIIASVNEL